MEPDNKMFEALAVLSLVFSVIAMVMSAYNKKNTDRRIKTILDDWMWSALRQIDKASSTPKIGTGIAPLEPQSQEAETPQPDIRNKVHIRER